MYTYLLIHTKKTRYLVCTEWYQYLDSISGLYYGCMLYSRPPCKQNEFLLVHAFLVLVLSHSFKVELETIDRAALDAREPIWDEPRGGMRLL